LISPHSIFQLPNLFFKSLIVATNGCSNSSGFAFAAKYFALSTWSASSSSTTFVLKIDGKIFWPHSTAKVVAI
jgi:hypothetical protein